MKKIKSSFIGKAFFSLILLYLVVFLFLFVFQGIVFRVYYTREKINEIKNEITLFVSQDEYNDTQVEELIFSRNTSTFTSFIPVSDLSSDLRNLNLTTITVATSENEFIDLLAPNISDIPYNVGDTLYATSKYKNTTVYIPNFLSINDSTILRGNTSTNTVNSFTNQINLNDDHLIEIEGKISEIEINTESKYNVIVSNEILNIVSDNYISNVDYSEGSYYFSNRTTGNESSLVFYSVIELNNEDHLLISVFPMANIDEIVLAAGRANVYMFIVVLLVLIISAFVYSREFSKPLLFINRKTKELSNLDFSSPKIIVDSSDEFSELANNINILSANLSTTLYRLNEQNKQLSDSLEQENKNEENRRDFIQGMSHELKTPLAVIQASAEALDNNIYETEEEINTALSLIQAEVQKTKQMLNSMVNVYKLDSPNYQNQWTSVSLDELIRDIDATLDPLYSTKNLEVNLTLAETSIKCDKDRMETIISNLYTNAIKYTPNGNKINIFLKEYDDFVHFEITNYGVSISDEEKDKLFDAFYRADKSRSRKDGSTGLGLYIVNQTLEQYNSKCFVKSTGNSVTFFFTIKKSL